MALQIESFELRCMQTFSRLSPDLVAAISELIRAELRAAVREVVEPAIERMLVSTLRHFRGAAPEPEFYTVQQARDRLAVSVSTFYRIAKRREIRLLKRGRSTLIARAEVEALIARMKREAP